MILSGINQTETAWTKRLIIISGLLISLAFVAAVFYSFPYPYVECDFDSVYITNSLSILTDHTVRPNTNPGVTLQWLGTISIIIGSFFTSGRGIIEKVIANHAIFQQLNLALLSACFVSAMLFYLNSMYNKKDRLLSIALAACGIAFMFPPSLPIRTESSADFMSFIIAIGFIASLTKGRTQKNDIVSALLFALMVYSKIIYLLLGALFFVFDKKTFFRLTIATAAWVIIIYLLFWDKRQLGSFIHFMRNYSVINKAGGSGISITIEFFGSFFRDNMLQSVYILIMIIFSILLVFKKKDRVTGLITFVLIVFLCAMTFVRQYKAPVYMWTIFPIGIFLLPKVLRQYRKLIVPATAFIMILFILTAGKLYGDYSRSRIKRKGISAHCSECIELLKETSSTCLIEYLKHPHRKYSLGQPFWHGNAYAHHEYAGYIKKYIKQAWGLDSYYSFEKENKKLSDARAVRSYFSDKKINILEVIPNTGTLLAIEMEYIPDFKNNFPQLSLESCKASELYGISFFKVTKKAIRKDTE